MLWERFLAPYSATDIQPGGVCTTKDADEECVEGAICMNVARVGEAEILQCSCKPDFHEKTPVGGSPVCEAGGFLPFFFSLFLFFFIFSLTLKSYY